ncbi:MAG: oligosaccharide flippase family protein, partial [Pseudonocardiaceae bacterium]
MAEEAEWRQAQAVEGKGSPTNRPPRRFKARVTVSRRGSVLTLTGATYIPALFGLLTGPLVARALGPSGRGHVAAIIVFGNALPILLSCGIPLAIGQALAKNAEDGPALLTSAIRYSCLIVPPAILIEIGLLLGPLGSMKGSVRLIAAVILGFAPLSVLSFCLLQLLSAEGALGSIALIRIVHLTSIACFTILLWIIGDLTVTSYLIAQLLSDLASFIITVICVGYRPKGRYPLRTLLRFGLRGFIGSVASMANARIDQMIMVTYVSSAALGIYAVSVSLASMPLALSQSIATRGFGEIASAADPVTESSRYIRITAM